jgi:hypothetical protein
MNKFVRNSLWATTLFGAVALTSCNNEDPPLPDNTVEFQTSSQGISSTQADATVTITLTRAVETAGNVVISFTTTGLTYGEDFITNPVIDTDGKIVVPVAVGETTATFTVTKTNTNGLDGTEKIDFTIESLPDGLVIGARNTFSLSFSEIIAQTAEMEINGGGVNANNRVFIDLSANRQTAISRNTWDLAFSSDDAAFRVYLNSANKMLARVIDKNDLAEVTAADTVGWGEQLDLAAIFSTLFGENIPEWAFQSPTWIDSPSNFESTAIAEIDATGDNNLVYIINRGTDASNNELGWLKIRVVRNGSNFDLQYANINDANFKTVTIEKDNNVHHTYFSFATEDQVNVEPARNDWDIAWTGLTNTLQVGPPGDVIAYYYQDMIIQNPNVQTAQVLTSAVTYDAYAESNIANTDFVFENLVNIGSSWRDTQSGPVLKEDRFYVIKDGADNVYKLKFTALVVNGERGKPHIQFDLVKKGS